MGLELRHSSAFVATPPVVSPGEAFSQMRKSRTSLSPLCVSIVDNVTSRRLSLAA
jgi:hypothetical protein